MRAYEFTKSQISNINEYYDPSEDGNKKSVSDTRSPVITLRHLNKLKHIRRKHQRDHDAKMDLVSTMYGDPQLRENDLEAQQQALENLKDQIANQIDAAAISQKDQDHIAAMALNGMRSKKQ